MKKYFLILALAVLLSGCTKAGQSTNTTDNNANNNPNTDQAVGQNTNAQLPGTNTQPEQGTPVQYTMSDVAMHSDKNSCWTVANGKVYDVTASIDKHPGGDKILQGCGKDMTQFFNTQHMKQSKDLLPSFYIGDLK